MAASRTTSSRARRTPRSAKKPTRAKSSKSAIDRLESELPPTLRDFSRRVRRGLVDLEKRIEHDGREARRRGARMLREASHQLGQLEARGEREWRKQSLRTRRATVQMLRRLERAIKPPQKKKTRKKKTTRTAASATAGSV